MPTTESVLYLKRGSLRKVPMKLTDGAGAALPLADRTGPPRFQASRIGTPGVKIDSVGQVTNESGGIVEYQPVEGDVDTPGTYWGEWRVPFAGGDILVPENGYIRIVIQDDVE